MTIRRHFATAALSVLLIAASRLWAAGPPDAPSVPPSTGLTVPAETEASVVLLSGIHTKLAQVRDPVEGQLTQPVYVDGQLALPQGTLLYGHVTRVRPAGRLHRPGEIGFLFDQVSLPSGETEPVTARLSALEQMGKMRLDREGYLKGGRQLSWNLITGTLIGSGGLLVIPRVAGATVAATAASVATAGFMGGYVLIPHGPEVHLPPSTRCRVRFDYAFTVHGQS
jgi:hypothetical protein